MLLFKSIKNRLFMTDSIISHPTITYANDVVEICKPLLNLNISYFSHVLIHKDKTFSAIGTCPANSEHYLRKKYYNHDIHMANLDNNEKHIVWDSIQLSGESAQMLKESDEMGHQHIFTMVEKNEVGTNYFHFATHLQDERINQVYISNLDILATFTEYFREMVSKSIELKKCYDIKFKLDQPNAQNFKIHNLDNLENSRRQLLLEIHKHTKPDFINFKSKLSQREMDCLNSLIRGRTAKETAVLLKISYRTVESHLENIKFKLGFKYKREIFKYFIDNES